MEQNIINQSMKKAAHAAGKILRSSFNHPLKEKSKNSTYYDVVSQADTDSENIIIRILTAKFPQINILSEERGLIDNGSSDTIVIDPLDGSSNFLLGLPHFSVALVHFHFGEIIASVVYNPILDKMYFAEKGKGAFLNEKRLGFKIKRKSSCVAVNFSHKASWKEKRDFFDQVYKSGFSRVINNWSPNLDFCLLAENNIDAVVSSGSLIYDFAPGYLIAKESGSVEFPKVKEFKLNPNSSTSFVIANKTSLSKRLFTMV